MSDSIFGIHAQALKLRELRAELLSGNVVNASTPNYKARDFDFQEVLSNAEKNKNLSLTSTQPGHFAGNSDNIPVELKYRLPGQPSVDGNTVDGDLEKAAFADNAMKYEATLKFLKYRIHNILSAIKGE